jgi:hypothetical protein
MKRCDVRNLFRGDCSQFEDSRREDGLCYYHGKLADGHTAPPGDYVDNPEFPSTATLARVSYENSTHPEFAPLVDFGRSDVGRSLAAA